MSAHASTANTLTIEYVDEGGQIQRVEQLYGSHFTLRVSHEAAPFQTTARSSSATAAVHPATLSSQSDPQMFSTWLGVLTLASIYALLSALDVWIEYNPDNATPNYVVSALGVTAAFALWAAIWALFGKIIAKQALYWQHLSIVLIVGIVLTFLMTGMHLLSFSLSWRTLGRIDNLTSLAALGFLVWAHLQLIVPRTRSHHLRWSVLALTVLSITLLMWTNQRRQGTMQDTLHSPHLYHPALQLTHAQASNDFFTQARALEAPLKAEAAEVEPGEDAIDSDDD